MDANRRFEVMQQLEDGERAIFDTKGKSYTGGADRDNDKDTLYNFKQVGSMVQHKCSECGHMEPIGARGAWAVYYLKHVFSLMTDAADPTIDSGESIKGRILDTRVYGTLYACIKEDEEM